MLLRWLNRIFQSRDRAPLPTLPFDLVAEILCRLPVKLLVQLRCLCKSFNTLISDPKFAKKHLQMSTKRNRLMLRSTNNLGKLFLYDSPIQSIFSTSRVKQTQLNYPNRLMNSHSCAYSCDGIVCIAKTNFNSCAVLWNPSIQKFKILPPLETSPNRRAYISLYSFGYDHFIRNYKTVVISFVTDNSFRAGKYEVRVLALGTDSWRRIQDFPYLNTSSKPGVFMSSTVNWLTHDNLRILIVSLDLENESYQNLWTPVLPRTRIANNHDLGVLKDCLCIFANCDMFWDVWVMKEYGNTDSWTKLYHVPYMRYRGLWINTKILYVTEDDQLLMKVHELVSSSKVKLVVYNSKSGTLKFPKIQNIDYLMDPEVYIESLISPCSKY
ncbi:F-box protein interaction domain protein [Medicago truncatula]|uniref:F-box protein interaction domain protein n=2 Tax=Medicago truncatula TaxID=3880 RepID=A0A072V3T9_MEDTR|nr:F-box protein interaction domain protein [Medicago truncatula]